MPFTVRITANFFANLDSIRRFLGEQIAAHAFNALQQELFEQVIPNLEQFPQMGRDFLARRPLSSQGKARVQRIKEELGAGAVIKEYIHNDYLMLYLLQGKQIALLSIRHHRQLSFNLRAHWT
jgi:hypothetical protein